MIPIVTDLEITQTRSGIKVHGTIGNDYVEVYYFYLSFSDLKKVKRKGGEVDSVNVVSGGDFWEKKGRYKKLDDKSIKLLSIVEKFIYDSGYHVMEGKA